MDLHEGLESTLLILHHRLRLGTSGSPITVEKCYGNLPYVQCYAGQLNQVFMNLISNAIDELLIEITENQRTPTIRITTSAVGDDWVAISIKDNGRGILEEVQSRLFDPFFTTKPVGQGTGLGLSISYQIVEKHGGSLLCQSQIGSGTEFIVKLPIQLKLTSS